MAIKLLHSLRKLDSGSLLIESMVLMVGVFLALQAENWNEQRKENIEAKAYHVRLQQDFESIRYQTEEIIKELDLEIVSTKGLSDIFQQNLDSESITKAKEYLGEILYIPVPVSPSATYIEMLGGNKIYLLSDTDLIGKLIKCNVLIEGEQSNFEMRNRIYMDLTPQVSYLNLDIQHMPLGDALDIASEDTLGLQRSLTLHRLTQSAARGANQSILECATVILNKLASME